MLLSPGDFDLRSMWILIRMNKVIPNIREHEMTESSHYEHQ
jgi:hypothetical protein